MPSQGKYELEIVPLAQSDIEDILQYTHETYGEKQRRNYSDAIRQALENIRATPKLGHSRDDIDPGYRAWNVNSHTIIYGIEGKLVSVFRILHGSMDFKRHDI